MTRKDTEAITLVGKILEEEVELSLADLCRASQLPAERVIEWVHEGVIEPVGRQPETWRFQGVSLRRVRCARRLEEDLGVNTAGVALALDLLEEIERLRARLSRFDL
jgi:chaperone modulatory protein CbpM